MRSSLWCIISLLIAVQWTESSPAPDPLDTININLNIDEEPGWKPKPMRPGRPIMPGRPIKPGRPIMPGRPKMDYGNIEKYRNMAPWSQWMPWTVNDYEEDVITDAPEPETEPEKAADLCSGKSCGEPCDSSSGILLDVGFCQPDGSCGQDSSPTCTGDEEGVMTDAPEPETEPETAPEPEQKMGRRQSETCPPRCYWNEKYCSCPPGK